MKRAKFSLSNTKLASFDFGELVPVGLLEVLPGDSIQQSTQALVRASPMVAPVMHPVDICIHHWFVPHRLIWEDWEDFITGGPDGLNASVFPTINFPDGGPEVGTLADYLGVPTDVSHTGGTDVSALPFRAYAKIWNEFYRDQDLQTELVIDETSGPDTTTSVALQNVCWNKDYFTSARPWEQKGPSISIPIGTSAPVTYNFSNTNPWRARNAASGTVFDPSADSTLAIDGTTSLLKGVGGGGGSLQLDPQGNLVADLSAATAATVNLIREAFALQRFEEARARYGSRYVEYLRYLGVRSSDARLQRPEYLGGGRQSFQFSEVLQTAEGTDPVGELKGHGIATPRSNRFRRFFEEHGYLLTLMFVRPKTIYQQGLERTWNRRTKEDFFQVELQHIGQQEVLNKEVYASHTTPGGSFGYQDRYDEYRRQWSSVAGEFRTTLDFWHFARQFSSSPALNASFVSCVPREDAFAVPSEDVVYAHVRHSIQARRLVAGSGTSFIY